MRDRSTAIDVKFAAGPIVRAAHDAAYWDSVTVGFDFSGADLVPPALFNRVLWSGLMGDKPYPDRKRDATRMATGN